MSEPTQTTRRPTKIERAAKALAWADLTEIGRASCDWKKDFSPRERQEYRVKARIVMEAITGSTEWCDFPDCDCPRGYCPVCGGDCADANPPVAFCPVKHAP